MNSSYLDDLSLRDTPSALRVIKTARTERTINRAVKKGFRALVKPVDPSEKILDACEVYQHNITGRILVWGDARWTPDEDEYDLVVPYRSYYPYHFPSPFAAYLIPPDLAVGERVWLDDIIEDIVACFGNQGNNTRLDQWEATWTGTDFTIHFDPAKDAPVLIG